MIKELQYRSYAQQRKTWLNLENCDKNLLESVKEVYEDYIHFEKRFTLEENNEK